MNLLSLFSFFNCISFIYTAYYICRSNVNTPEAKAAVFTNLSFAVWTFGFSFFYAAETKEAAWFWIRVASLGICTFPSLAAYYYLSISKVIKKISFFWKIIWFAVSPLILLVINLLGVSVGTVSDLVQSDSGLGWTYIITITSFKSLLFIAFVLANLLVSFILVHQWGKTVSIFPIKKQVHILVYIYSLLLLFGMFTDIILPSVTHFLPPMVPVLLFIIIIGNWLMLEKYSMSSFSNKSRSQLILNTIMDPVIQLDPDNKIIKINQACVDLLGYSEEEMLGMDINILLYENNVVEYLNELLRQTNRISNYQTRVKTKENKLIDTVISAALITASNINIEAIVLSIHDITCQKEMENILMDSREKYKELANDYQKLANVDELTGLSNRRYFFENVDRLKTECDVNNKGFILIYMDLNNFKAINDMYGHTIGDLLLVEVAERLQKCIRKNDYLSRIGGDEFVFIIKNNTSIQTAQSRVAQIRKLILEPVIINDIEFNIGISAGYSVYPNNEKDIEKLIRDADNEMYLDKQKQKICYFFGED